MSDQRSCGASVLAPFTTTIPRGPPGFVNEETMMSLKASAGDPAVDTGL